MYFLICYPISIIFTLVCEDFFYLSFKMHKILDQICPLIKFARCQKGRARVVVGARNLLLLIVHTSLVTKMKVNLHHNLNIVMQLAVKLQTPEEKETDEAPPPLSQFRLTRRGRK